MLDKISNLVSLDSETLSKWDDAIVLSLGACVGNLLEPTSFDELIAHSLFLKFDITDQKKAGRLAMHDTKEWWRSDKSNEEARKVSLYPNPELDLTMERGIEILTDWINALPGDKSQYMFADRNLFDFRKLQHMIEVTLNKPGQEPWDYHNLMDFSTMFKSWGFDRYVGIYPSKIPPRFNFCYHNPVHDAALDWLRMQHAGVKLGLIEFEVETKFNGLYYEKI